METWGKGGRHGKGIGEALHPVISAEMAMLGADVGESLESLEEVVEWLDVVEVDQEVEEMLDADPPRRRRRRRPA